MTAIFVHGVPETPEIWAPVVDQLDRSDVVLLNLPGFGSPAPAFEPTMQNYAEWLGAELAVHDEVDLVAHDWGALLALKVLSPTPTNVRSWAVDGGDLDASFEWHDLAKLWISSEGEGFMEGFVSSSVEDRAALLTGAGVPEGDVLGLADAFDATMASCILTLYRSSVDIGTEWGPGIDAIGGPGLVFHGLADPFVGEEPPRRLAQRTGARVADIPGGGHWWMLDAPGLVAELLQAFWADPSGAVA